MKSNTVTKTISIIISSIFFIKSTAFSPSSIYERSTSTLPAFGGFERIRHHHQQYNTCEKKTSLTLLLATKIGIFFGTSTGSTEDVADLIAEKLLADTNDIDVKGPFEIDEFHGTIKQEFQKYDVLLVGTPTWNTAADTERSGTGWDEIYYSEMQDLDISDKKVAIFGLGDQISYSENYADGAGELHDVFESLGCKMMGYTNIDDTYEHDASKSVRDGKFCGLLCDAVNQEDLTEGRILNWIAQLKNEGLIDDESIATATVSNEEVVASSSASSVAETGAGKIGIFFGTSTGSTEDVADLIAEHFNTAAEGPFEIDSINGNIAKEFQKYDALIVGTPTWNTGADTERSGTGWDEVYYGEIQDVDISGKNVAVFGLGDQISYDENYADGAGELHDVFETLGCKMMGYTSMEGYEHESSKAIRDGKFCGLLCDAVNQEELTDERVQNWVLQLKNEGIIDDVCGGAVSSSVSSASAEKMDINTLPTASAPTTVAPVVCVAPDDNAGNAISQLREENARLRALLEENSSLMDETLKTQDDRGYTPHYNAKAQKTMWTSPDGRTCYYTTSSPKSP